MYRVCRSFPFDLVCFRDDQPAKAISVQCSAEVTLSASQRRSPAVDESGHTPPIFSHKLGISIAGIVREHFGWFCLGAREDPLGAAEGMAEELYGLTARHLREVQTPDSRAPLVDSVRVVVPGIGWAEKSSRVQSVSVVGSLNRISTRG
jgi:hypothetical protein